MLTSPNHKNTDKEIAVAIVEDNNGIRESLKLIIDNSWGYKCVGIFSNANEAITAIPVLSPDVILMDINMPGMDGIECVRILKKEDPDINVLMLTIHEDSEMVFKSLSAGASGYLLKRSSPTKILEAIHDVRNGGSPMSPQIARMVVQSFGETKNTAAVQANLTPREHEILTLLSGGFLYKEIASRLEISIDTVKGHLRNIYEKLQVHNRTEAVVKFLQK